MSARSQSYVCEGNGRSGRSRRASRRSDHNSDGTSRWKRSTFRRPWPAVVIPRMTFTTEKMCQRKGKGGRGEAGSMLFAEIGNSVSAVDATPAA